MNEQDKLEILRRLMPKALLQPMTPEAKAAVPAGLLHGDYIIIDRFPFRVGRESRVRQVSGKIERVERVKAIANDPTNDLYLIDQSHRLNISREHFQIDMVEDSYRLLDRGSACGTRIGEELVGSAAESFEQTITDGDLISVGAMGTPYVYRFFTLAEFKLS